MSHLMAAESGESNLLLPDVWEIVVVAVGFVLLLYIVSKYIAPAFEKIYQDRVEAIEGGLAKAEKAQAEAAAAREEYSQQLESARLEAQRSGRRLAPRASRSSRSSSSGPRQRRIASRRTLRRPSRRSATPQWSPCAPRSASWPPPWPARSSASPSRTTSAPSASWTGSWPTLRPPSSGMQVQRTDGRSVDGIP